MIDSPAVAPDAAIVLGIATTAMPFARTPEDEAERWLRILRLHGEAGAVLQALGVSEGRLQRQDPVGELEHCPADLDRPDRVVQVVDEAVETASHHGRCGVTTVDLLVAVMNVYGEDFDRVLYAHGSDRAELQGRI